MPAAAESAPPGRLDRPPPASARALLPSDFGSRLLIFVDTEEEFDWSGPRRRDATSVRAISALPAAHRRFRDWGVSPTYLVDYPVADNERSAATLRPLLEAGECTVGAQLHPWVNPPLDEEMSPANSFVGNLPRDMERAKLAMLTRRIRQSFGETPTVYRGGRYGLGPNSAALLEEAGYRLDVSVRALFDYRAEGGPDFSRHPISPWWAGPSTGLLELPLTATFTGGLRGAGGALYPLAGRIPLARSMMSRSRLLSRVALTPEGMPLGDGLEAIRVLLDDGVRLFSLSFHSPSVEPGHTPYVRDAADLRRFWAWWDGVLAFFAKKGVAPARPADLLDAAWRARTGLP